MLQTVTLVEVGPRDGLQNERRIIETADKVRLIDLLSACGFKKIEVTSFVSPKWVPQLADAPEVLRQIKRSSGVGYLALTPNLTGYARAKAVGVDEVAVFASASESFSRRNINCSITESLTRFIPLLEAATADGLAVRGYVSCITHCPYEGPTPPRAVAGVAQALLSLGCHEVSLGETLGHARPEEVSAMLKAVLEVAPPSALAGHFHDTQGHALANVEVCLAAGLRTFDASVAGLGGCPYTPGAKGNVASEALARFLEARGFKTGIDLQKLEHASAFAKTLIK